MHSSMCFLMVVYQHFMPIADYLPAGRGAVLHSSLLFASSCCSISACTLLRQGGGAEGDGARSQAAEL